MASQYWLVSLPLKNSRDETWNALQKKISEASSSTQLFKLFIPELRVGTLDSLLALSDDLVKINAFVEGVSNKILRQLEDLGRSSGVNSQSLTVDGVPIETYVIKFSWDEAKYPIMTPLKEIVDTIVDSVTKLEDDLKIRVAEYSTVKSQLGTINRKYGGSMLVKDLSGVVKEEDIISSEHMTTLLVVIPRYSEKDWLKSYETLSSFVVPRSSKKILEDNEFCLYTVTLFRKVVDNFRIAAREKGFQIRDYDHDPEGIQKRRDDQERLTADQENMQNSLNVWCAASYGEVFSSWLHINAIRLFAESILRYGLPPAYQAAVIIPKAKNEKRIRAVLDSLCTSDDSSFWKNDEATNVPGLFGSESDNHPYVSFTLQVNS